MEKEQGGRSISSEEYYSSKYELATASINGLIMDPKEEKVTEKRPQQVDKTEEELELESEMAIMQEI